MSDAVGRIMQIGLGFWPSKALLTAIEFDLFTHLGQGPLTGEEIRAKVGWHPRGVYDLLDGLVALGMPEREGSGPKAKYRNGADSAAHCPYPNSGTTRILTCSQVKACVIKSGQLPSARVAELADALDSGSSE